jgi:hypothetical protein
VLIDERLTPPRFAPAETTKAYLEALERMGSRTACRWRSLDAVIARNAPSPTGSLPKGMDNGLARYGAKRARFAKPLSTPTQPAHCSQTRDISTWPEKGDISTLP